MTDVSVHYHNGTSWIDLTDYAKAFEVQDHGITQVPTATVNFETARSNLNAFLANPYRLIRIRANPGSWQNLFYGYVDEPYLKAIAGTIEERSKMSLDCLSFASRLSQDHITFDYYKLQSALTPSTGPLSWTFRDMMQDFLDNPDSRDSTFDYGTGFDIEAAADASGIDRLIDGAATWDNQTLFEAVKISAEHIGYDGYYYLADETATPKVMLYPYNKASTFNLTAPFIKEPEWRGGSLADISNKIYVEGGVDQGIPSDGDRWTEYGYIKYTPKIWSATRAGATNTLTDEDNTQFGNAALRVNSKCVKFSTTGSTNHTLNMTLNLANTEQPSVNGKVRIVGFTINIQTFGLLSPGDAYNLNFILSDGIGNKLFYRNMIDGKILLETDYEKNFYILFSVPKQPGVGWLGLWTFMNPNTWYYYNGATAFDWSNIVDLTIQIAFLDASVIGAGQTFGAYIDGFQFVGGQRITQFHPLNPPASDTASINAYGIHPFTHNDAQISSFEQAQAEAARILNNLTNPIPTLQCTKLLPNTQLYPSNVVTTNSVDYRIANIVYEWRAKSKPVTATYNMVTKTSPLPPIWTQINELRYIMR